MSSRKRTPQAGKNAEGPKEDFDDGLRDLISCPPDVLLQALSLGDFVDFQEEKLDLEEQLETISEGEEGDHHDRQEQAEKETDEGDLDGNEDKRMRVASTRLQVVPDDDQAVLDDLLKNPNSILWKLKMKAGKYQLARELAAIAHDLVAQRESKGILAIMQDHLSDIGLAVALTRISVVSDFDRKFLPAAAAKLKTNTVGVKFDELDKDVQTVGAPLKSLKELAMYVRNHVSEANVGLSLGVGNSEEGEDQEEPTDGPRTENKAADLFDKYEQWWAERMSEEKVRQAVNKTFEFGEKSGSSSRANQLDRLSRLRKVSVVVEKALKTVKMLKIEEENKKIKKDATWLKVKRETALDPYEVYVLAQEIKRFYVDKGLLVRTDSGFELVKKELNKKNK